MATETLSIRMDSDLKRNFDRVCSDLGMSMTTAVTMLAKTMTRNNSIPADLCSYDPFYSDSNMKAIEESLEQIKQGKVHAFTWEEFEEMARKAENE